MVFESLFKLVDNTPEPFEIASEISPKSVLVDLSDEIIIPKCKEYCPSVVQC